jgi:hypothetical protein
MKINQFFGCYSVGEIQLRYDELSKVFVDHDEILKVLRSEYSTLMNVISEPTVAFEAKEQVSISEKIKELQDNIRLEGLQIEICGTWLWVTGKTFQVKESLKELGFRYSSDKLSWYYRQSDYRSGNQKPVPLEMIREKYGTNVVAI